LPSRMGTVRSRSPSRTFCSMKARIEGLHFGIQIFFYLLPLRSDPGHAHGTHLKSSLNNNVYELSELMEKWMMRQGKLTPPEEDELGNELLLLAEKYLDIQEVIVNRDQDFESSKIVECTR